jgi:hypothetical protein
MTATTNQDIHYQGTSLFLQTKGVESLMSILDKLPCNVRWEREGGVGSGDEVIGR